MLFYDFEILGKVIYQWKSEVHSYISNENQMNGSDRA
jgi:hypothetical protein